MTALKITKQTRETPQRLTYRFIKKTRESGILLEARKRQFRQRSQSRQAKKMSALRRQEMAKEYEKLKKLGKV
jgi:ribosomal protein S21